MPRTIHLKIRFPYNYFQARAISIFGEEDEKIGMIVPNTELSLSTNAKSLNLKLWPHRLNLDLSEYPEDAELYFGIGLQGRNRMDHLRTSLSRDNYLFARALNEHSWEDFSADIPGGQKVPVKHTLVVSSMLIAALTLGLSIYQQSDYQNFQFLISLFSLISLAPYLWLKETDAEFYNNRLLYNNWFAAWLPWTFSLSPILQIAWTFSFLFLGWPSLQYKYQLWKERRKKSANLQHT